MHIENVDLEIQREPFARPFGFKGSCFHEKWNAVVRLRDDGGTEAYGLGGLAVLWSDAAVFAAHTETGGNLLMLSVLERTLQEAKGIDFEAPPELLKRILPAVHDYAKTVTGREDLRPTFTLNALVGLDNAAWVLWARRKGVSTFDEMIPQEHRQALIHRQNRVAIVPLVSYTLPLDDVKKILEEGAFFLKIKIGQPGTEEEMLRKDMARLDEIHGLARQYETPATESGKILYYLDANGRYTRKESLLRLLGHAEEIGMARQIAIVEEPFAEELTFDVSDIPARLAADESLHSVEDVRNRAEQGYGAVAIKPAGKTLSVAFEMASGAHALEAPCYVADNGCVPALVDWNKNFAARLPAFPGLSCSILESNGPTTYATWDRMLSELPYAGAPWLTPRRGAFELDETFYARSGGILLDPGAYVGLFRGRGSW